MKASVKVREVEGKAPLLRFKLPIKVLTLPFTSSISFSPSSSDTSSFSDLSFHLRSALPAGPSLKLSYHPPTTSSPAPSPSPFSLSLVTGISLFGSPLDSPLLLSAHFSSLSPPAFSLTVKPRLGDFSLKSTAKSDPSPNPNPVVPKENGCGVHHPIPFASRQRTGGLDDLLASGVIAVARTSIPVGNRATVRLQWGVNLPKPEAVSWRRLPYLTVDKITIEAVNGKEEEKVKRNDKKEENAEETKEFAKNAKSLTKLMLQEVEELREENRVIRNSVEELKRKAFDKKGKEAENSGNGLEIRRNEIGWEADKDGKKQQASTGVGSRR